MKKYKFVKLGAFNSHGFKDIFIGKSSHFIQSSPKGIYKTSDIKGLEDKEFMSMEEVEDYINSMESEWNFQGFQQFFQSKVSANELEMIIYYAVFWKESID